MEMRLLKIPVMMLVLLSACSPIPAEKTKGQSVSVPPVIKEIVNNSQNLIALSFDKDVKADAESFTIVPGASTGNVEIKSVESQGKSVSVIPQIPLEAGTEYFLKGTVSDNEKNSTSLGVVFFGYNPDLPSIVINEFTSNGSDKNTDMVELYAKTAGNIAGITLFGGTKNRFTDKIILSPKNVKAGDYIVIHFKPQSLEKHTTGNDFLIENGTGLSGNNGAITLYSNPYGELLDAVIYTNRTSESDDSYRGFGSTKFMLQAEEIYEAGGWQISGDEITPEDCVPSANSTATRSICRPSTSEDTDSNKDWHTVPTSKYSFGAVNSDELFEGK